jgi:large conductance mechanosensitive channel
MLSGFKKFLMRGNIVDLAIAVVIGGAFGAVVNALVKDIVTPIVAAIVGKPDFGALTFTIHKSKFFYGDLLNNAITFVSVAAAIYFIIVVPMERLAQLRKRGEAPLEAEDTPAPTDEAKLLMEIRDLLARQAGGS